MRIWNLGQLQMYGQYTLVVGGVHCASLEVCFGKFGRSTGHWSKISIWSHELSSIQKFLCPESLSMYTCAWKVQ